VWCVCSRTYGRWTCLLFPDVQHKAYLPSCCGGRSPQSARSSWVEQCLLARLAVARYFVQPETASCTGPTHIWFLCTALLEAVLVAPILGSTDFCLINPTHTRLTVSIPHAVSPHLCFCHMVYGLTVFVAVAGIALRVPTPNVSVVDLVIQVEKKTFAEEVNEAFREAANGPMKGILVVSDEPLVSKDFACSDQSSTIDSSLTMVMVSGPTVIILHMQLVLWPVRPPRSLKLQN
jgi:hypothetical protein